MEHLRNIRRVDDDSRSTHAWIVQVQRRSNIIIKMFSDSIFGGKQEALSAALEYRELLTMAPSLAEHNLWHRTIVRRNNTSGIPGVGLYKRPNGTERWVAFWIDENHDHSQSISMANREPSNLPSPRGSASLNGYLKSKVQILRLDSTLSD